MFEHHCGAIATSKFRLPPQKFRCSYESATGKLLEYCILLEIAFIKEMRTAWGNNEVPLIFFTIFFIRENTIQSVWLRTIANPIQLAILWYYTRLILQNFS